DGSRITPSVTFGDSSLGEGASGEEEKLSALPKPPSGRVVDANKVSRRKELKTGILFTETMLYCKLV
ncbi:MAG: hypothetical protein KBF04_07990, partial [Faecalibacterium sp.]|nr:hypothetical protein [Faecalibacterium sp.]